MLFIVAILLLSLLAFNSHAMPVVDSFTYTPAQCKARPALLNVTMPNYWDGADNQTYAYYDGCEYKHYGIGIPLDEGYLGNWYPTGRVQPSNLPVSGGGSGGSSGSGTGSGSSGTSGGNGGDGGSSGGNGSSGAGSGSGSTGWDSVGFPSTGSSGGNSGSTSGFGGTGGSSGGTSGFGGTGGSSGGITTPDGYGITFTPGNKPGEMTTTFNQPLPAPASPGEPTQLEIRNYMKEFFIYGKECGNSCLDYFNTHNAPLTPVSCMDLGFNLNVPHKKPDCRSDDIAWYDSKGNFIDFKYQLTDKARHDIINKLKGDFSVGGSSGSAPFYPGVSKLPLPVEVTNPSVNFFNVPSGFTTWTFKRNGYKRNPSIHFDDVHYSGVEDDNHYEGITPFELLSVIDGRLTTLNDHAKFSEYYGQFTFDELRRFHKDSNDYNSQIIDRLNTDNLDSVANDSVSKLSSNLTALLNGQNAGGQFSEASALMGQIGNGSDSPLLGKFLDSKLIPIVDTRRCDMPVFGRGTEWEFTLNSVYLYKLKQILTFIMYALTFWYLFDMLTNVGGRD